MLNRTRLVVWCALAACWISAAAESARAQCVTWQQAAVAPSARDQHVMAYDFNRHVTILFGGLADGPDGETWEYDGTSWKLKATTGPSPRVQSGMVFDSSRNVCVLFGGDVGGGTPDGQTWEWDGSTWTQQVIAGPSARFRHSMDFDSNRGVTVLFGGYDGAVRNNQTWEYNGTAWTQRAPAASPSARSTAALAFDDLRNVSVLFGGTDGANFSQETWEWNGTNWTLRAPATSPSARTLAAMSFDAIRNVCVMTAGRTAAGDADDTWEWNGTNWTLRNAGALPLLEGHITAFDAQRNRTVMFGGAVGNRLLDVTREWNGTAWSLTPVGGAGPRTDAGGTFDAGRGTMVIFGGQSQDSIALGDTWERTGSGPWTQRAVGGPLARYGQQMVYDSAHSLSFLFGGFLENGNLSSGSWTWDGTSWVLLSPAASPSARMSHAMAFDASRGVAVLFGGDTGPGAANAETWEWNGTTWTQRVVAGPSARYGHAMAYDSVRHVVVLFGGWDGSTRSGDTWEWNGTAWTQRVVSGPSARRGHTMAYDPSRAVTVLFGGQTASASSNETWEWNGTAWTQRSLSAGPGARYGQVMAADTARNQLVIFGGPPASATGGQTWEIGLGASPGFSQQPAAVNACTNDTPHFIVALTGSGPFTYQWRRNGVNLVNDGTHIAGAASSDLSIINAVAGDAGTYTCAVTGACGNLTSNSAALTVSSNPVINTQPTPVTVCSGGQATFTVAATSGQTLTYRWRRNGTNLNNGGAISGATSATLTINPVAAANAGNYTCVISSACGNTTSSAAALTVNAVTAITTQPTPATVCTGSSAGFTVVATGSGTLSYQWRRNGTNLSNGGGVSGATTATLTINPAGTGNAGNYDVVVTGTCGSATSSAVALIVSSSPTINTSPSPASPCAGTPLNLTVAATGSGTLSYQWRRGGTNLVNGGTVSGTTSASLSISAVVAGDAGNYDCVVTNTCGSTTSSAAAVTVGAATSVSQQPGAATVCTGLPAGFSVTASGTGTLTYQWRRNGTNLANGGGISGAATSSLSIAAVAAANAGTYDCVVAGSCGSATSTTALLTVTVGPTFSLQPAAAAVCNGQPASFTVAATGSGTLAYQWRRGGTNLANGGGISGATTPALSIAAAAPGDAASYDCVVTNTCGSVTSSAAALTVNPTPSFSQQPASVTRCEGLDASFAVTASGTGTLVYQWRHNGANLSDGLRVTGANSATLQLTGVASADAGTYDCVVTTLCGSATSSAAALAVDLAPSFSQQPTAQVACNGQGATFSIVASGSGTLGYQWRHNGQNLTGDGNISGASTPTLHLSNLTGAQVGTYDCVVTNACASATSTAAALTVNAAPALTQQPAALTLCPAQDATFTVDATGTAPLAFQWRKNGTNLASGGNISGATSATLTVAAVGAADAASYDCVITNSCGTATSSGADLTVNAATAINTQPSPETRCAGQGVTLTVAATGSGTLGYQWRRGGTPLADGPTITGSATSALTISAAAVADAGNYDCVVSGACGSVTSSAALLTVNESPAITSSPAALSRCTGQAASLTVAATGTDPLSYQWRRNGTNLANGSGISGATTATLSIAAVAAGSEGNYDCVVSNSCGSATSAAAALTVNAAPAITEAPAGHKRCAGQVEVMTVAATGTEPMTYQWRKDGQPISNGGTISGATTATLTISAVVEADAGEYSCLVTNTCGSTPSAGAVITVSLPPSISTPPAADTRCAGQSATFSVTAGGPPPYTYQWRRDGVNLVNGPNISGATTASLTVSNLAAADGGTYDVLVSNLCGPTTSPGALLTVRTPPSITQQPQAQSACVGTNVSFTVAASGTGPLTYQWRRDGTNMTDNTHISGSTTATLTLSAVDDADPGSYDCVITNACSSATSNSAAMTLASGPGISQQPQPLSIWVGQTATLSVTVTSPGQITSYEWRRNGTPLTDDARISGSTTATLTITPAARADTGDYTVFITSNACGTVTSSPAALAVYCTSDYDRNGAVEPSDIALFVFTWYNDLNLGTLVSDFDGNGAVEPSDISLFVATWYAALTTGSC